MLLLTTLFQKLDQAVESGSHHFLIAFSGGLDSTVLLHACCQYRAKHPQVTLSASHIHHGLSMNADDWAKHCQQVCQQLEVPLSVEQVKVIREARVSLEASARDARYCVLHQQLSEHSVLLTAHHLDDQVETLLLALKRGSGLDGLSAMPEQMALESGCHLRPLLPHSRAELEAYASEHQLDWIEDESNQDESFDRNFIRNSLMPQLQNRWPGFASSAARSIHLLGSQRQILEELATDDLARCLQGESLSIKALSALSGGRRDNVLRLWLRQQQAPLFSFAQLQEAWQAVALARDDAQPDLVWDGWRLRRYQGALFLQKIGPEPKLQNALWSWPEPHTLATGVLSVENVLDAELGLRPPYAHEVVSIRFACPGSLKIHPAGRSGSRPLKKVWQEQQVPPWIRPQVPMLFYDDTLVAAVGYWLEKAFVENSSLSWLPRLSK